MIQEELQNIPEELIFALTATLRRLRVINLSREDELDVMLIGKLEHEGNDAIYKQD